MKPCISQATTLKNPFEADPAHAFPQRLDRRRDLVDQARNVSAGSFARRGPVDAGSRRDQTGRRSVSGRLALIARRRACQPLEALSDIGLTLLAELGVPALVVTPDFVPQASADDYLRAAAALGEAAELAATFGVRLALEFQKTSPFCACLETAMALIEQSGAVNAGVCLDVFHFYTGPSKTEDLAQLTPQNLAWVQVSDLSGTPRELAGDSDRILPGEGDFQLGPIIEHLGRIGYDGHVSLEVLNPHLWQVDPDRLADLGRQALLRVLGPWEPSPAESKGGP